MRRSLRWLPALGVLTCTLAAHFPVASQDPPTIHTQDGLAFTLPAGYRSAPELTALPGSDRQAELAFAERETSPDLDQAPIHLFVIRAPELATSQLSDLGPSDPAITALASAVRDTLGMQAADVRTSEYDPERGALRITLRHRSSSQARGLVDEDLESPAWRSASMRTIPARGLRCILATVLADAPSVTPNEISARAALAATQCEQSAEFVQTYLAELGPEFFAPFEADLSVAGYFTRTALVMTLVVADSTRAPDAARLANDLYATSQVSPEARPLGTGPDRNALHRARQWAQIVGSVLGALLGLAAFGVLLGLGLRKLGLRSGRAATIALASPPVLLVIGWLFAGPATLATFVQMLTYLVGGSLAQRPLQRWLDRRSPPRSGRSLLRDTTGLTTLEYSVLFVALVAAAVLAWRQLGDSLVTNVRNGEAKYSAELETSSEPNADSAYGDQPHGPPTAPQPPPRSAYGGGLRAEPPPSAFGRLKAATIDHPAVKQFERDHPIATTIAKELLVTAAEVVFPPLAVVNSARAAVDPKATRTDKTLAGISTVTSAIPVLGAVVKGAVKLTKAVAALRKTARAANKVEETVQASATAAQAASRSGADAANRALHERYVDTLRATMERPHVQDPKLSKILDDLYRPGARYGSGSTAAAVRHERATGSRVGGRLHTQKAADSITRTQRWLDRNPTARPGDRAAAENVIKDLRNALGGN